MEIVDQRDDIFDAFNLVRGPLLGRGSSGEVVLASAKHDMSLKMAVKIISLERQQWENQFDEEVTFLRQLRHPHILKIVASSWNAAYGFIVMNYYQNGTLYDTMSGPVKGPRMLRHTLDVDRAILGDFGLAIRLRDSETMVVEWVSTPGFYGPETPMCPFKLDMYSLGITMWVLIYKRHTIDLDPLASTDNCSNIKEPYRRILLQLLHEEPRQRWSAADLLRFSAWNSLRAPQQLSTH
ncbi:LRR receptor-like serine/threonine-protein kinase ERECTA [Aplysia californica]|uniref:non-specific serine/threonine protein kinase n=1 Tax=Aplysia californica TaxID=6500 RepID=A0ABM0JJK6_APLCA|nr:LRR receptor-like serine/threonine-protein kinase ERECTA [Aplysia californica]